MQSFEQYLVKLKADLEKDETINELPYLLFCDAEPNFLEGQTPKEAGVRTKRALEFFKEVCYEVTDADRQQVLAGCFHCADPEALLTVGRMLGTSTEVWSEVIDEIFGDLMPCYPDWWLTPELLEDLKTLTRESGLDEIENSDPRVMVAAMGVAMKEAEGGDEHELGKILETHGYELLPFVKAVEPLCAGYKTTTYGDVEIAAEAYLESTLERGLDKEQIMEELASHDLTESKWVGWTALKAVADYLIRVHENMPFAHGQGEWMAEYLGKIRFFYPECTNWEFISESAERMLNESYTVDHDRAALAKYGFSLEELADAGSNYEPTSDELDQIEASGEFYPMEHEENINIP